MVSRRRFLQWGSTAGAAMVAPPWISGCSSSAEGRGPSAAAWAELRSSLTGTLALPGDPTFPGLGLPRNLAYSDIRPQGVALCVDAPDVQTAVRWANQHGITPMPRSPAAHSFAGYGATSGLSIDLSAMGYTAVNPAEGTADVGAGAMLGNVGTALRSTGLVFPVGQCATVGVSGLLLAGGLGFNARRFGLTCDQLVEADIVTADGELRRCNATDNADLYWALRGGGGGTFGINTSFKVKLHPVLGDTTVCQMFWRGRDEMAEALSLFQQAMLVAPRELSGVCTLLGFDTGDVLRLSAQLFGSESEFRDLLAPLFATGPEVVIRELDFVSGTAFLALNAPSRKAFQSKSAFFDDPLPDEALAAHVDWMARRPKGSRDSSSPLFAWGGAIGDMAPGETAFVHRTAKFLMEACVSWYPGSAPELVDQSIAWLEEGMREMRPYSNGGACGNFMDRTQVDWETAYYGQNFPRLVDVKRSYDPGDLFHFEQSIPTQL